MITDKLQLVEFLRLAIFIGLLLLLILAERLWARRAADGFFSHRRGANLGLLLCAALILKALPFVSAVAVAQWVQNSQWGLSALLADYAWPTLFAAVLLLDLAIYWQHRLMHRIPALWRLHRVHHSDQHLDVTTALRFHPAEILLSMLYKMLLVAALGVPVLAVVIFEALLNAAAMFNHANLRLNADGILRWFVVTPDMHRVHHSIDPRETNSNYGFFLSCWDRLFGSYTAQPKKGHLAMRLGLEDVQGNEASFLSRLLINPFKK